jgi:hypothetical protein
MKQIDHPRERRHRRTEGREREDDQYEERKIIKSMTILGSGDRGGRKEEIIKGMTIFKATTVARKLNTQNYKEIKFQQKSEILQG